MFGNGIIDKDFTVYESEGAKHLSIGSDYRFSPSAILIHILRSGEGTVLAKKSWILTDDFQAEFSYKGFVFVLCTPWDSVDIHPFNSDIPHNICDELYGHIKNYQFVHYLKRLEFFIKHLFVPWNYTEKQRP